MVRQVSGRIGGGNKKGSQRCAKDMASLAPLQGVWAGRRTREIGWRLETEQVPGQEGACLLAMGFGLHPVGPAHFSSFVWWLRAWILESDCRGSVPGSVTCQLCPLG